MINGSKKMQKINRALTIGFTILAVIWIMPIITVVINSFKTSTAIALDPFSLPNAETFMKFGNYIKGMTFGNYPFYRSVFYSLVTLNGVYDFFFKLVYVVRHFLVDFGFGVAGKALAFSFTLLIFVPNHTTPPAVCSFECVAVC